MIVTKIPVAEKRKPRVCAYVRVSTDKEAQEDSFAFQSWYWNDKLSKEDDVEYVGLFSDEGISGKRMRNRRGLNEMLAKARNGEIDRIYTKSISRFARNYTELMAVVRELRDKGIPIIFEKENIDTLDPKCGLILSVMASLAEEELISMSKNLQWAARKRFANGSIELTRIYGYDYKDKQLTINPEQAKVVKKIFDLYLAGYGAMRIANMLDEEGISPIMGGKNWNRSTVLMMLANEKYKGDCLLQKNVCEMNTHRVNRGELPQYYLENSHQGIISAEEFDRVQEILKTRAIKYKVTKTGHNTIYPLSGKIICGECGASFTRKTCAKGKTYECIKWSCLVKEQRNKTACSSNAIKDEIIIKLLLEAYNECVLAKYEPKDIAETSKQLQSLLQAEKELKELHIKKYISNEQYKQAVEQLLEEIKSKEEYIKTKQRNNIDMRKYHTSAVFTQDIADFLIKAVVKDWQVTFIFANGYETTRNYTNGRAGNVNGKLCKHKT